MEQREDAGSLSVAKAARALGVHPNTVRAWSDAGILRSFRLNERGDRRFAPAEIRRFLAERVERADRAGHAEPAPAAAALPGPVPQPHSERVALPVPDDHARHRELDSIRAAARTIGRHRDLEATLDRLLELVAEAFDAAGAGIFLRGPDGRPVAHALLGMAPDALAQTEPFPQRHGLTPFVAAPFAIMPLASPAPAGVLVVEHEIAPAWGREALASLAAFGGLASAVLSYADDQARSTRWAGQLESIHHLGVRLASRHTVAEIGRAIATELRQLIPHDNLRAYLVSGDELVPVVLQGHVDEYLFETPDELRLHVGEGIAGWVAAHGLAQNLHDAARDPRALTIPGTTDDLDESMLLAPMLFEDQVVGVLVLARLGLNGFSDDDLRLLVICAGYAAQAVGSADAHERLQAQSDALSRRVRTHEALLRIGEALLSTHEQATIVTQVADHAGELVTFDTLCIEMRGTDGGLVPVIARGERADLHMDRAAAAAERLMDGPDAAPVSSAASPAPVGHDRRLSDIDEPHMLVGDLSDPTVTRAPSEHPHQGTVLEVPLRGTTGMRGVLTLERVGHDRPFLPEDLETLKLLAAQVSIALQRAEAFRAIEIQAQTDGLTGLLNRRTLHSWLPQLTLNGAPFSLLMLDLDHFKEVNDRRGHQAGDLLLQRVAYILVETGRGEDRVFRWGGDEFVLALPECDEAGAMLVAERIRARIEEVGRALADGPDEPSTTASIGIASWPEDGGTPEAVLLAADRACYASKAAGRNRISTALEGRLHPPGSSAGAA